MPCLRRASKGLCQWCMRGADASGQSWTRRSSMLLHIVAAGTSPVAAPYLETRSVLPASAVGAPPARVACHSVVLESAFSASRSLVIARRIEEASSGDVTLANPLGAPALRSVIRVPSGPRDVHV